MPVVNPGIRRFLGSAIQRLLNGAAFALPLTHTAIPERGDITPSFTRATTKTGQKWDEAGYLDFTALAGEIVWKGARREYNQWTTSSVSLASGANKSLTLAAGTYQFSMGAGTGTATFSGTGGATGTLAASTGRVSVAKTISAGTFVVTASVADLADLQVCNITGETDQTTIRPYVSVGVESAPAYHGSMVDGVRCFGTDLAGAALTTMTRYKPEPAATNLLLGTSTLTNTTYFEAGSNVVAAPTITGGQVGPTGQSTAVKLAYPQVIGAAAISSFITAAISRPTVTAAAHANSWYLKGEVGGEQLYIYGTPDGATFLRQLVTLTTSWQRYTLVGTPTAAAWYFGIGVDLRDASQSTKAAQTIYADLPQLELGSTATSYIPTTTIAVTRNADILTYTGADVANIKTLAATFSRGVGVATAGTVAALSDNTANEYSSINLTSATAVRFDGVDGGVSKWQTTASNAYTPAATSKAAYSAATNSIKMDLDGTAQTEDTVATLPTVTQVQVGHLNGATVLNGPVGQIFAWTRNLSQSELGAIDA